MSDLVREFDALYREQRTPAIRLAFLLCGDLNVAEDVVAEAFARTYSSWRKGRVRDGSAYVRRAVVNEINTRGRRWLIERRQQERHPAASATASATATAAPHDLTADRQVLVEALQRLPMHQRAAIVLRFFEDLSEAETARVLGKQVGTVKSSVSRGLDRLRELLGEE